MSSSPFRAEDSGLLVVFMEPGVDVSEDEFHEWYGNEHIPIRLDILPEFRSAARYRVTSSTWPTNAVSSTSVTSPGFAAIYTISSNALFSNPSYTCLRDKRSERESDIFRRIAVVDRRAYRLAYDTDTDPRIHPTPKDPLRPQTKAEVESNSPYIVAHSVTPKDLQGYAEWFDQEHALLLSKVPGWSRSRRYELIDNGVVGKAADKQGRDKDQVPKFLGIHEFNHDQPESTQEYKESLNTEWRTRVVGANFENLVQRERRTLHLYRAYDPVSALRK
ncbi:hypothetical protein ACQY0O_006711 [Thecaphora frezii]